MYRETFLVALGAEHALLAGQDDQQLSSRGVATTPPRS
jgi:hypothetical protein